MILVTGASGFVGGHLCAELRARELPYRAVSRQGEDGGMAIGSISSQTDWRQALEGVTTVIHLAARVHIMTETSADPLTAFRKVNVDGSTNLARQAAAAGVRRFIYVSSIKVNGEATLPGKPFRASDQPNPADPYGLSKLEAEQSLSALASPSMTLTVIRPPLIYGRGVAGNFRSLVKLTRTGIPLPFGAIHNRRSLLFVGNLVDMLLHCIESDDAAGQTFMLSDGKDLSTTDLLQHLRTALNSRTVLLPVPMAVLRTGLEMVGRSGLSGRLLDNLTIDPTATFERLNWRPPFSIGEAFGTLS